MPFITEEIWQKLREIASDKDAWPQTIMHASWAVDESVNLSDAEAEKRGTVAVNPVRPVVPQDRVYHYDLAATQRQTAAAECCIVLADCAVDEGNA